MKKLCFDYFMKVEYSEPVSKCYFTIKCTPERTARQQITDLRVETEPYNDYSIGRDGFGNRQIYGTIDLSHSTFCFHVSGVAVTGLADFEETENENRSMIFRHPYGLAKPGPAIEAYFRKTEPVVEGDLYRKAIRMMNRLHRDMQYEPNSTSIHTTAEEAFLQKKGVCQDYAHIFIALLRLAGIPARYVTGLIVGEGASHAWVEILYRGKWYGLDPTNNILVTDEHIKIAVGRDASDCTINRGIMHGGGTHVQSIAVKVKEMQRLELW